MIYMYDMIWYDMIWWYILINNYIYHELQSMAMSLYTTRANGINVLLYSKLHGIFGINQFPHFFLINFRKMFSHLLLFFTTNRIWSDKPTSRGTNQMQYYKRPQCEPIRQCHPQLSPLQFLDDIETTG